MFSDSQDHLAEVQPQRYQGAGQEQGLPQRVKLWKNSIDKGARLPSGDNLPPGFAKLFRLAQLIIQYLLHSQKKLTEAIKILQNNNSGHQKVNFINFSLRCVINKNTSHLKNSNPNLLKLLFY